MWRLSILLTLLTLAYKPVFGREVIISPETSTIKITTQAGVAIDGTSNLSIDQLKQTKFAYDYKSIHFGRTEDTVWIKLSIKNTLSNPNLIININNPTLDKVSIFQQRQGEWLETELGDLREFHQRIINLPTFAIPISINKNFSEIIYLRFQSIDTLSIPIKIFSQSDFSHYLYSHYISFGILYGIPLGLLLYNFLIFLSVRKRTHLLYCLVIVSNTFVSLSWDGITYSLFPDSSYFQQRSISLSMCLTIICLILFSKSFLQTKHNTPKINTYLNSIAFSAVILSLLVFSANTSLFYIPIVILAILMIPGLVAAGIARIRQQYIPAKIYLLATGSFLLAVALCALSVLNVLPLQEEITYIYKAGVISELILLSLGIAERIKALKASKQSAIEKIRVIEKEKLKSENLALSKANYLKDTFLSTISHELRTPMNGVKGALALLDKEQSEAHKKQLISTINQSSDTMINLIERLILFTELKAGRIKNKPSSCSISKLVENELTLSKLGIEQQDLEKTWLIMYVLPKQCELHCEQTLMSVHNTYVALGKEKPRVKHVALVQSTLSDKQRVRLEQKQWTLIAATSESINELTKPQVLIVDTLGNVVLSHQPPIDVDAQAMFGKEILADLKKLLKYSRIG